jgi:uncharacterized damage-inducible protein DinB
MKAMTLIQYFLNQLEKEAPVTRKMLGLVPDDKFEWQPHPKSMSLVRLAAHVAEIPGWVEMVLDHDELVLGENDPAPAPVKSNDDLLRTFDENLAKGIKSLQNASEEELERIWTMRYGDQVWIKDNKAEVLRMSLSQLIHHRAQLGVFLRLLNVPIPGPYGPSADEMEMMQAEPAK